MSDRSRTEFIHREFVNQELKKTELHEKQLDLDKMRLEFEERRFQAELQKQEKELMLRQKQMEMEEMSRRDDIASKQMMFTLMERMCGLVAARPVTPPRPAHSHEPSVTISPTVHVYSSTQLQRIGSVAEQFEPPTPLNCRIRSLPPQNKAEAEEQVKHQSVCGYSTSSAAKENIAPMSNEL